MCGFFGISLDISPQKTSSLYCVSSASCPNLIRNSTLVLCVLSSTYEVKPSPLSLLDMSKSDEELDLCHSYIQSVLSGQIFTRASLSLFEFVYLLAHL